MDISQFKFHHTEVYYDDYAFLDSLSTEERQKYLPQDIAGADEVEPMLMGVPTGGKRALSNGSEKMLLYVNYYDRFGRVVQTCEDNILGKVDYNGTTYSFTGMPVTAEKLFNHSSSSVSHLVYTNTYDALDRTHGLDLYDSEARWYDSLLGRTSTMDPLAEKYYSLSPYLWCAGNPVRFVDPDGRIIKMPANSTAEQVFSVLGNLRH
ncbi:MAG: hypothetical protein PUD41_05410 [bacterium]|nr:hypothetical protein [bacterium]